MKGMSSGRRLRNWDERTICYELVLKADVEGSVGVGCECHSFLASDIFRSAVFIAYGIFDLDAKSRQR